MYILTHLIFEKQENEDEKPEKLKIPIEELAFYSDDSNHGIDFISGYITCLLEYELLPDISDVIRNMENGNLDPNGDEDNSLTGFILMDKAGKKHEINLSSLNQLYKFSDLVCKLNSKN